MMTIEKPGGRMTRIGNELRLDPRTPSVKADKVQYLNGGLPRHIVLGGDIVSQYNDTLGFLEGFRQIGPGGRRDGKVVMDTDGNAQEETHRRPLRILSYRRMEHRSSEAAMRAHAYAHSPDGAPGKRRSRATSFSMDCPQSMGHPTPTPASRMKATRPASTGAIRRRLSRPTWS